MIARKEALLKGFFFFDFYKKICYNIYVIKRNTKNENIIREVYAHEFNDHA